MSKSLVIVESPAKAKTISKYLGNEYIVKSSVGHIRDLPKGKSKAKRQNSIPKDASPEEKARLKKEQERRRIIRRMGVNPDDGWTANYEIIPDKEKVIKDLRKASKEVEKVYLATDLDREGEAIAWHLKEALGKNKFEYHRVRFNEITKSSILESFADPKEIDISSSGLSYIFSFFVKLVIFFTPSSCAILTVIKFLDFSIPVLSVDGP